MYRSRASRHASEQGRALYTSIVYQEGGNCNSRKDDSEKILCHCRGHKHTLQNRVDFTISSPEVMFEIYNIPAGCCKFQTSRLSLVPFKGPKKSRAPQKVSILCRDHLESLKILEMVPFRDFQGLIS